MTVTQIGNGLVAFKQGTQVIKLVGLVGSGMPENRIAVFAANAMKHMAGVNVKIGDIQGKFSESDDAYDVAKQLNSYFAGEKAGLTANVIDGKIEITVADADGKNVVSSTDDATALFGQDAAAEGDSINVQDTLKQSGADVKKADQKSTDIKE